MDAATRERTGTRPPLTLAAGDLAVTFEWIGDRWRHRVTHRGRLVAESVEGPGPGGDPRWPASPPCQEVTAAGGAARPALLAVGAAGRSHFAASLAVDDGLADTVLVEVACRVREPAAWLGSTYAVPGEGTVRVAADEAAAPPRTVCWTYRLGPAGVTRPPAATDGTAPPRRP